MLRHAALIRRDARVVPAVPVPNRLDTDHAHAISRLTDQNPIICEQCFAVDLPRDIDGKITFVYNARGGHHVHCVDRVLAKIEGDNLRQDWGASRIAMNEHEQ
jgi:hypothetical protein